jgi:hypothetical protein
MAKTSKETEKKGSEHSFGFPRPAPKPSQVTKKRGPKPKGETGE